MKTIDLAKCGLLTAILMITAQISINIGPIPLTGGVLGILLIGYILKPTYAFM
jgi:biotin transporter BioY